MSSQQVELEFSYTEAEYLSAARLLIFRDSNALFRLILSSVYIVGVASILTGLLTEYPWWLATIAAAPLVAAIFRNALVQQARRHFRGDRKLRDRYRFIFSDEGIAVNTALFDSRLSWSLYTKVIEGSDTYLLVYGKDIRMMTVVPKRVFRDTQQENGFRELLSRHIISRTASPPLQAIVGPTAEYKPASLNPPDWR